MSKQYYSILTNKGEQLFSQALATKTLLNITQMAIGDGNGKAITPNKNSTKLAKEVYRTTLNNVTVDPRNNKQVIFEIIIPENVGGFYIREAGLYDENNHLIAIANTPESYKPVLADGSGKISVLQIILTVNSVDAVTLTVNNGIVFATRENLNPQKITANSQNKVDNAGHSHEIEKASTTVAGIVKLVDDLASSSTTEALTANQGKELDDKKFDKAGGKILGDVTVDGSITLNNSAIFNIAESGNWRFDFNINSEIDTRFDVIYTKKDSSQLYIAFPQVSTRETVAYQSWVLSLVQDNLVGIPLPYPLSAVPSGFLAFNGQAFSKTIYPKLAKLYPTGVLPDLRGEFIRGWDNGRGVDVTRELLSYQDDSFKHHEHYVVSNSHGGSGIAGTNLTSDSYLASHAIGGAGERYGLKRTTKPSDVALSSTTGGNETRPRNVAFQYICLAG